MATLNKSIKSNIQHEIYEKLAAVYQNQSEFISMIGQATRKSFAENLKYHAYEADSLREIYKEREAVRQVFLTSEKSLLSKKEKLWRAKEKDVHKWGAEDSLALERIKNQLFSDKDMSFDYMLVKESSEVEKRREEMSFFTNQCWDELRRMTDDNGIQLREHYVEMAQVMGQFTNNNQGTWADFQQHFNSQINR